jgi:hypothetical protein
MCGIHYKLVPERIGPPCATIEWTDVRDIPAWLSERIDSYLAGEPTPRVTSEPLRFFSLRRAAMLLETSCAKAEKLLGSADAIYICRARSYKVWQACNVNAAWLLITDSRASGDFYYSIRPIKRRPKPPRRLYNLSRRPKPASRVRFISAPHRWANPRDVAACRVSKQERESLRKRLIPT